MIPLEKQVCSLDLAKRLKELGVRQESLFIWNYYPHTDGYKLQYNPDYGSVLNISAFTVAELGEMLPQHIKYDDNSPFAQSISTILNFKQPMCAFSETNP